MTNLDGRCRAPSRWVVTALLVALVTGLSGTSIGHAATRAIPSELQAAVALAESRGAALYGHDVAAARATDELARRKVLKRDRRLRGWITEPLAATESSAIQVTFVGEEGGVLKALHRVTVGPESTSLQYQALKPAPPLTEIERAAYTARQTALAAIPTRCTPNVNTVVIPNDAGTTGWWVYVLSATTRTDVVFAGGHRRFALDASGTTIEAQREFTKSCIELPQPKTGKAEALLLTHLLDPTPTEIHVFLNRLHRQDLYVSTTSNGQLWRVTNGRIFSIDTGAVDADDDDAAKHDTPP